jgi:hypothetical protein
MTVSINGTTGLVFNDASTQATAATGFGFKNRIINGDMRIDQRNAGASVTPTGGTYTLDRWTLAITQSSKLIFQQSSVAPAGFKNSLITTVASAVASPSSSDQFLYRQMIEGFNVSDLGWGTANAQPITVSFWVRSSVTGTFPVAVLNGSYNRSYVSTYTVNSANTFEYKTVTIAGDTAGTWATDNTVGINLSFALGTGSNRTTSSANTWAGSEFVSTTSSTNLLATSGATFYITGVMLEKGSTATNYDVRPYGTELALCQRYLPAFNSNNGFSGAYPVCNSFTSSSGASARNLFIFKVSTRVPPTGVSVSSASSFTYTNGIAGYNWSSVSFAFGSTESAIIDASLASSTGASGQGGYTYANTSTGQILFTGCEL